VVQGRAARRQHARAHGTVSPHTRPGVTRGRRGGSGSAQTAADRQQAGASACAGARIAAAGDNPVPAGGSAACARARCCCQPRARRGCQISCAPGQPHCWAAADRIARGRDRIRQAPPNACVCAAACARPRPRCAGKGWLARCKSRAGTWGRATPARAAPAFMERFCRVCMLTAVNAGRKCAAAGGDGAAGVERALTGPVAACEKAARWWGAAGRANLSRQRQPPRE
jgi:hypothetical protein